MLPNHGFRNLSVSLYYFHCLYFIQVFSKMLSWKISLILIFELMFFQSLFKKVYKKYLLF